MNKNLLIIVVAVVILVVVFLFKYKESSYLVIKCPGSNEPVTVIKDISKAYPVYATQYQSNLNAVLKKTKKI